MKWLATVVGRARPAPVVADPVTEFVAEGFVPPPLLLE